MARHAASDGAGAHPLVAEALQRHPGRHGGAHRERAQLPGREGPVGWPGPEPDESSEPVGWPGGMPECSGSGQTAQDDEQDDEPEELVTGRPRGWRRLIGRSRAA